MKFEDVRRLALSFPEVNEEPHFQYTSFRVRARIFMTAPPDERHAHVFVDDPVREVALAAYPEFVEKLAWGKKVVGLRVELPRAKPGAVRDLVGEAWRSKAPKNLQAQRTRPARRRS